MIGSVFGILAPAAIPADDPEHDATSWRRGS